MVTHNERRWKSDMIPEVPTGRGTLKEINKLDAGFFGKKSKNIYKKC